MSIPAPASWAPPSADMQAVLDVLEGVNRTDAEQWEAACPLPDHEHDEPKLQLSYGENKPVIVYCIGKHSEDWDAVRDALLEAGAPGSAFGVGRTIRLNDLRRSRKRRTRPAKKRAAAPWSPPPELPDERKVYEWNDALLDGAFPDLLDHLRQERGLSDQTISDFKLGGGPDGIRIPIRVDGKWRNVKTFNPNIAKHIDGRWEQRKKPHAVPVLYPSEVLPGSLLPVLLCESEFDALLANQESEGLFVAVTGTGGAPSLPRDLHRLKNREVFVAYDADEPGRKGAEKVKAALIELGANPHILDVTRLGAQPNSGQDIGNVLGMYGRTAEDVAAEMDRLRAGEPERFKLVSAADLARPVPAMRWLVAGVWPEGSYGVLAGEKKTLKTQTLLSLALAVASGEDFLGRFAVPTARPVLMYLGEGGELPTRRRLQRLAATMGLDLAALPLHMAFDAGDITGDEFRAHFTQHVADVEPGLVIVDPLYAFHPPGVEAQNLYDRGAMLAEIQQMMPRGVALVIADHFKKTGAKDLDLDSIAQAGMAQWADSWILQAHREPPRVDVGEFSLGVQYGSRQWGGRQYEVDWSLGELDEETAEHVGALSVAVREAAWGAKPTSTASATADQRIRAHIITTLQEAPDTFTATEAQALVVKATEKGDKTVREVWKAMEADGLLVATSLKRTEGDQVKKTVTRNLWKYVPGVVEKLHVSVGGDA